MQKTVQGGKNGCRSITYKIYNLNGVEVSREVLSEDTYSAMNKIIQKFLPFFQEHLFEIFFLSEDLSKKIKSELVKISNTYKDRY